MDVPLKIWWEQNYLSEEYLDLNIADWNRQDLLFFFFFLADFLNTEYISTIFAQRPYHGRMTETRPQVESLEELPGSKY